MFVVLQSYHTVVYVSSLFFIAGVCSAGEATDTKQRTGMKDLISDSFGCRAY